MILNKHNLNTYTHASNEDHRPALTGLKVEKNRTIVTDGYRLLTVDTPKVDPVDLPTLLEVDPVDVALIPIASIKQAVKAIPNRPELPILANCFIGKDQGRDVIKAGSLSNVSSIQYKEIDAPYPQVDEIIPEASDTDYVVTVNAKYLKEMALFFEKNAINSDVQMRITAEDHRPIVFTGTTPEDQKITGLIMPFRK